MSIRVRPAVHPGDILREDYLTPLGLTRYALGKEINMHRTRIEHLAAA